MGEIINKVAKSNLIQLSMSDFIPKGDRMEIDLKELLYKGIVLKEKPFRDWIKNHDWELYKNSFVAIYCSEDSIIPNWAYMLIMSKLVGVAKYSTKGNLKELEKFIIRKNIESYSIEKFENQTVIIKGCDSSVDEDAWLAFVERFQPVCKSIMFGEPCSTVPIYKKPRT